MKKALRPDSVRVDVYQALKSVIDPELGVNIVDLGLVYDVKVAQVAKVSEVSQVNNRKQKKQSMWEVRITMTLTSPGCPLSAVFDMMVREAIATLPGVKGDEVEIQLTFDPPWTADMMSAEARAELGFD